MTEYTSQRAVMLFGEHHQDMVWSVQKYAHNNKQICICHMGCKLFKPGTEENCPIAEASFELSKKVGVVLVHSCKDYQQSEGNKV